MTPCSPIRCHPTRSSTSTRRSGWISAPFTPQEIAVSILAELIAVKHGKAAGAAQPMKLGTAEAGGTKE